MTGTDPLRAAAMTPYYSDDTVTLWHGDCLDVLAALPGASVDAVVTDPPYGLEFMGKEWDSFGGTRNDGIRGGTGDRGILPGYGRGGTSEDRFAFRQKSSRAYGEWCEAWAAECLRVLKPGGHMLAFGGTRTWHRLACAVEDAGFEVRDSIAWLYGSGFPKSLDVSKAIDKQRTEDRQPVDRVRSWLNERRLEAGFSHDAVNKHFGHASNGGGSSSAWMTNPTSRALPTWEQWQELKRLFAFGDDMDAEVWRLNGRKGTPGEAWAARDVIGQSVRSTAGFSAEMVPRPWKENVGQPYDVTAPATDAARQWQGWGTALKPAFEPIVVARKPLTGTVASNVVAYGTGALNIDACRVGTSGGGGNGLGSHYDRLGNTELRVRHGQDVVGSVGRWPANVVLDDAQAAELDQQSGTLTSGANPTRRGSDKFRDAYGEFRGQEQCIPARGVDSGGASRFFPVFRYEPKAPTTERPRGDDGTAHPTVKPLDLIRWLVRLVTPPGGTVLDPFLGSGTTAEACIVEGFRCIGVERDETYLRLAAARLAKPIAPVLFGEGL